MVADFTVPQFRTRVDFECSQIVIDDSRFCAALMAVKPPKGKNQPEQRLTRRLTRPNKSNRVLFGPFMPFSNLWRGHSNEWSCDDHASLC